MKTPSDKGKPGESQGRKATDLRARMSMTAGLPKKSFLYLPGTQLWQVFAFCMKATIPTSTEEQYRHI